MTHSDTVDHATWLKARLALLAEEKALNDARERVNAARRSMPAVKIDKPYLFDTPTGQQTLSELFCGHSQLLIYHFMFGKDWLEGCPSCSFWADNYDGVDVHLAARDISLVTVSSAPLPILLEYRKRMNWRFNWVSSGETDFNQDFGVTFEPDRPGPSNGYNYGKPQFGEEMPGISIFKKLADDSVAHCYSTYGRGLDMLNGAYHLIDLTPRGRNESGLPYPQAWVRRRDQYESDDRPA